MKKKKQESILEELKKDKEVKEVAKFLGILAGMVATTKLIHSLHK